MKKPQFKKLALSAVLGIAVLPFTSAAALGTYADGWVMIKLAKFESRGILIDSFEGLGDIKGFNKDENCDKDKDQCYTPVVTQIALSVRSENAETANFMRTNVGKDMLIHYRIHRIEPLALSTDMEVLEVKIPAATVPADFPTQKRTPKTGSRSFSVYGRFLRLEYAGTAVGTYEGLYMDEKSGKIYPFSITSEEMANFAYQTMQYSQSFYFGVSVAIVTGWRKSDHDIFEVNYKEPADAVVPEKPQ